MCKKVKQDEAMELCQGCLIFKRDYFCGPQAAEFRAIPWNGPICPYRKWKKVIVLKVGDKIKKQNKRHSNTTTQVSEEEMKIMNVIVRNITTNILSIDKITAEYRTQLALLEANPKGCSSCAKGKLLKTCIKNLKPVIHLWKQP